MKRPEPQQTLGLRLVGKKGLDAYESACSLHTCLFLNGASTAHNEYPASRLSAFHAPSSLQGLEAESERDGADADWYGKDAPYGGSYK